MAEAIMNLKGRPKFTAYSAGSRPSGAVRPEAIKQLEASAGSGEPCEEQKLGRILEIGRATLDFIFTVCDNAAKKALPSLAWTTYDCPLGLAFPTQLR
jgi:arsenate reductase